MALFAAYMSTFSFDAADFSTETIF